MRSGVHEPGPAKPLAAEERARFRVFRAFNDPDRTARAGSRGRLNGRWLPMFPGDTLHERLARELAERRALPAKELFESFEFFERVRRALRAPEVADLCAGHGLTGLLFAVFEREVEHVTLLDERIPANHAPVLAAVAAVAPWVKDKVRYVERRLKGAAEILAPGTSIAAVHACGVRTDRAIELAISLGSALAVLPCCYEGTGKRAPEGLRAALGVPLAADVDRTYSLEAAGYSVRWTSIPAAITPVHRLMLALPRLRAQPRT